MVKGSAVKTNCARTIGVGCDLPCTCTLYNVHFSCQLQQISTCALTLCPYTFKRLDVRKQCSIINLPLIDLKMKVVSTLIVLVVATLQFAAAGPVSLISSLDLERLSDSNKGYE